jgi:RNA-directed DNA polymerase
MRTGDGVGTKRVVLTRGDLCLSVTMNFVRKLSRNNNEMTKETEKSDGRVVAQGRRKPPPTAAVGRGAKATTGTETAEQLRLPFETAASPQGGGRVRKRGRPRRETRPLPKSKSATRPLPLTVSMEEIANEGNLRRAFDRVASNKGAPGPDRRTIEDVRASLDAIIRELHADLVTGRYRPGAIRRVWIPKSDGGKRGLGIPNVIDRIVQQAVHQVLSPWYEASFHPSSHGFRPGRSCHTAIAEAREYLRDGHEWIVDIDLEKFFDKVPHDRLMSRLEERIRDARLLRVIRRMLKAKVVLPDGVVVSTDEGAPQGGPLSPLLSNIVLDELDQELARRGHRFVRYADDCNVYARSQRAAERVMRATVRFIEGRLGLKVNATKSAVARSRERHFLGFRLTLQADEVFVDLSNRSRARLKAKVRALTPRTWGQSLADCIAAINAYARGWVEFFGLCDRAKGVLRQADAHLRRRLRAIILHQWKTDRVAVRRLIKLGVPPDLAHTVYLGQVSLWRKSQHEAVRRGLQNAFFANRGLLNMEALWLERHPAITAAAYAA